MNTPNEWRLAPVGIALLKGHMGIANKLLRLPQADINFRMEDGETILLHMLASAAEANKEDSGAKDGKKKKNRCHTCKKKVGLTGKESPSLLTPFSSRVSSRG